MPTAIITPFNMVYFFNFHNCTTQISGVHTTFLTIAKLQRKMKPPKIRLFFILIVFAQILQNLF